MTDQETSKWQPPEEDYEETLRMRGNGREYRRPTSPDDDPYPINEAAFLIAQQRRSEALRGQVPTELPPDLMG